MTTTDTIVWETADEPEYLLQSVCGRFYVAPYAIVGGLSLRAAEDSVHSLMESTDLAAITAEAQRLAPTTNSIL